MEKNLKVMMLSVIAVIAVIMSGAISMSVTADGDDTVKVSDSRDRITDLPSPTTAEDFELLWTLSLAPSDQSWSYSPSTGTIVGDYYFTKIGPALHKIDMSNGEIVASIPSVDYNFMYGHYTDYIGYGDGMIVGNPMATVYDLDLNPLYKLPAAGQSNYHDGYMYVTSSSGMAKYDPAVGDLSPGDTKEPIWEVSGVGYVSNRYMYPVFVDGFAYNVATVNGSSVIAAIDLETGRINETVFPLDGYINGEMSFYDGHLYVVEYYGGVFDSASTYNTVTKVPVDTKTGTFDLAGKKVLDLQSTSNTSPLLSFNGFGYVSTTSGVQVIDMDDWEIVATIEPGQKLSRGGMAMTTFYATEENGYKVYLYVVPYMNTGTLAVYSHAFVDGEHVTSYEEVPDSATKQYCTETVMFGPNGELLWHNDSMEIRCYGNVNIESLIKVKGDINSDGVVDLADAILIANHVSGKAILEGSALANADYNGDGVVDLKDALAIIRDTTLTYPVDFDIVDALEAEIAGADITIYLDEARTQPVDRTILPAGTYYYTASAKGFVSCDGEFTITDKAVTVDIVMEAATIDSLFIVSDGVITGYTGPGGDVTIPDTIGGQTITAIGDLAFVHSDIVNLVIPDTVVSIGVNAFYDTSLASITLGKAVATIDDTAFDNTPFLAEFIVSKENTHLAAQTGILYDYSMTKVIAMGSALGDVVVPGTMEEIPKNMFMDLSADSVTFEYGVKTIGTHVFLRSDIPVIIIPSSVTSIGVYAFSDCSVTSLNIPGSVEKIPDNMARDSPYLQSVILNDGTTAIGSYVFLGCSSMKSISIPDSVSTIGTNAFNTSALVSLTLPDDVNISGTVTIPSLKELNIGSFDGNKTLTLKSLEVLNLRDNADMAFIKKNMSKWTNLSAVNVSAGNESLSSEDGVLYNKDKTELILYPVAKADAEFTIPDTVTTIGASAFSGNTYLEQVFITDKVTTIGASAFSGCTSLISAVFYGTSITTIGAGAFPSTTYVYADDAFQWNGQDSGLAKGHMITITITAGGEVKETFSRASGVEFSIRDLCVKYDTFAWKDGDGKMYTSFDTPCFTADATLDVGDFGISEDGVINKCYVTSTVIVIPETYMGLTVTGIDKNVIPNTVTDLTVPNIKIASSMFSGYTALTKLTVDVASIPSSAFSKCTSLVDVEFGPNVTAIGASAFSGCTSLEEIAFPAGITSIGSKAFEKCGFKEVVLPDGLDYISATIFPDCDSLTKVTLGMGTNTVTAPVATGDKFVEYALPQGNNAFMVQDGILYSKDISKLFVCPSAKTAVTIPGTVVEISSKAFQNSMVTEIVIPASVTTIGQYAFNGSALASVTFNEGLQTIDARAFENCKSIVEVVLPKSLTTINSYAFSGCTGMTKVTFNEGLQSIGQNAFKDTKVVSITIPDSVTTMDTYVFSGCKSLVYLEFGEGLSKISARTAYQCSNLVTVVIPANVTTIDVYAFDGTNKDLCIFFEGDSLPKINNRAVHNTATLYCHGSKETFNWGTDTHTHGTYWNVTFDVDGKTTKVHAPSGEFDLSAYSFVDGNGATVTTWYAGGTSYTSTDKITLTGDITLSNKNGA